MTDFNSCSPSLYSHVDYGKLMLIYPDTESLKKAIVTSIWNDDRLLREDIENIAKELLLELRGVR